MKIRPRTLLVLVLALAAPGYWSLAPRHGEPADDSRGGVEGHADEHSETPSDSTVIVPAAAEAAGIKTEPAGSGSVSETVTLAGRITLNQNTLAQVKARFPGIVREVRRGQGEMVAAGDVLAVVESNDSLQPYAVKSPIAGVILARNSNVGDVAGDAPLFTVADVSDVWAEFHVFPRDSDRVAGGQQVRVTSFEGRHAAEAPIALVLPLADSSSQTVIARATLPNPRGVWRPGMTVRGELVIDEREVPLAVRTSGVQRMEGGPVVFVQSGDRFTMRPVTVGAADGQWTEVRGGLESGEIYVSENSFLVKADIGKAGAEHEE